MNYLFNLAIGLDLLINALLKGSPYETLSGRAHRMRVKHQPYFYWLADAIDRLFFWQPEHCKTQWQRETRRRDMEKNA